MLSAIDLFSGAGLLSHGFASQGAEMIFACDANADAVATYNQNAKKPVCVQADIQDIEIKSACDLVLAGPPCQGFSSLGKRDANDARNNLSLVVADVAFAARAKMVVIENVPQFETSQQFKMLSKKFADEDYETTSWVLDAVDFGAAQKRKRSITIYSKIGTPDKPKACGRQKTVRNAFKDLNPKGDNSGLHAPHSPTPLALARFMEIPKGGGKMDIMQSAPHLCPETWFKLGCQATDVWGRIDANRPSNTIKCSFQNPSKGRHIHPEENRVITLREGARLQGIPDGWRFSGSRYSIARQIGNGVPIPLARAVARSIFTCFA